MLAMDNASRSNRSSYGHPSSRHKSGYEPSDTETDWQESPWHTGLLNSGKPKSPGPARTVSPLGHSQRYTSKNYDKSAVNNSSISPLRRRHNKSPKPTRHVDDSLAHSGLGRNTSPFEGSELRHGYISPNRDRREEPNHKSVDQNGSSWMKHRRAPHKLHNYADRRAQLKLQEGSRMYEESHTEFQELSAVSERSSVNRSRSMSAPKPRPREKEQLTRSNSSVRSAGRRAPPHIKTMIHKESHGVHAKKHSPDEINEKIGNLMLSKLPPSDAMLMQSTESISHGEIFFSRDGMALKTESAMKISDTAQTYAPQLKVIPQKVNTVHQLNRRGSFDEVPQVAIIDNVYSRSNTSSGSVRSQLTNSKSSIYSSKFSDSSWKRNISLRNCATNRQRTDTWLPCMRSRSCHDLEAPETRAIDETDFIKRALVVEELRPFWADKHSPRSLSGFICHKQQAQHLKQLISYSSCPHILFKGPSGSGKKSLSMALLHDLFGDSSWKISHDLRHFHVQETQPVQIVIPVTSSPNHVELNLKSQSKNARYALMGLVKEIAGGHSVPPEVSEASFKADYKVIILHDIDRVADTIQHLIKWIIDRYTDTCKIILCCEDDASILDSIKNRCKLITVDAPVTHEIMEVLIQIAKEENFELSVNFAARIATMSKQNLRSAVMALEACKAHNYPFVDEQPIPLGWDELVVEIAADILANPSSKRLLFFRGKFQKLLVEFVNPKLILQKLVEEFLKGVEASLKRELYYWHAYYDKRLPIGASALLKLEEFVAKFMSIYRRSCSSGQQFA